MFIQILSTDYADSLSHLCNLWMLLFTSGAYRTTPTCDAVCLTGGHAPECCGARVDKPPTASPLRRPLARYRIRRPDQPEHQNRVRRAAEAWACGSFEST